MRAVEERRQIINLDRANVDVLTCMNIKSAAKRQGKGCIRLCRMYRRCCSLARTHSPRKIRSANSRCFERMPQARKPTPPGTRETIWSLRKSLLVSNRYCELKVYGYIHTTNTGEFPNFSGDCSFDTS